MMNRFSNANLSANFVVINGTNNIIIEDTLAPFFLAGENSPKGHVAFCKWTEFEANGGKHMENFSPFASYQINIIILYFESLSKKIITPSFSFHFEELYSKLWPHANQK